MPSSAGSGSGKSVRRCAPRDSARSSAGGDQPRERVGIAEQLLEAGGVAPRARRSARPPRGSPRSGARSATPAGSGGRPAARLGDRRPRRAAAEHEALAERVRGEPVGAVQARCRRTRRPRTAREAWCARRGRRRRRRSGSGRRARPAPARARARARPRGRPRTRSGTARGSSVAQVEPARCSVPSASIRSRIAAVTWSRGASSSVNRSPGGVEQRSRPRRAPPR